VLLGIARHRDERFSSEASCIPANDLPDKDYLAVLAGRCPALRKIPVRRVAVRAPRTASWRRATEFILEGLTYEALRKDASGGRALYRSRNR